MNCTSLLLSLFLPLYDCCLCTNHIHTKTFTQHTAIANFLGFQLWGRHKTSIVLVLIFLLLLFLLLWRLSASAFLFQFFYGIRETKKQLHFSERQFCYNHWRIDVWFHSYFIVWKTFFFFSPYNIVLFAVAAAVSTSSIIHLMTLFCCDSGNLECLKHHSDILLFVFFSMLAAQRFMLML